MKLPDCGIDYVLSLVETITPMGRKRLRELDIITDPATIEREFDRQEDVAYRLPISCERLGASLSKIRDIWGTNERLQSGASLEDVELFEIKSFSIWSEKLRALLGECPEWMRLPDLSDVVEMLDPEGTGLEGFYICDSYDGELASVRERVYRFQREKTAGTKEIEELLAEGREIESRIKTELSANLRPFALRISGALSKIGELDFTLAKVILNDRLSLVRPYISESDFEFFGLFNPEVASSLQRSGKDFKPYAVRLDRRVLVIGGNMTGKSVFLRSVVLAQTMFQMGFFVPADTATMTVYESLVYYSGDKQSFESGLSSFAGEMEFLQEAIESLRSGEKGLFVFDEIGRSTNPVEGPAFLIAAMEYLTSGDRCRVILSSHYEEALTVEGAQLLMVRGLDRERLSSERNRDISYYIDHSLVEIDKSVQFPREGVEIARLLGIDGEFIDLVERRLLGGKDGKQTKP